MKYSSQLISCFSILVLVTAGNASARDLEKFEWYVQLSANSDAAGIKDSSNVIGQLKDATRGADRNDLPELGASFTPYLSVVFYRPEWQAEDVDYFSDYHAIARNKRDEWSFEVRSDDPWREVTLRWNGEGADLSTMRLVDIASNAVIPAAGEGVSPSYSFNMNGESVRVFQWIVLSRAEQGGRGQGSKKPPRKSDWQPPGLGKGKGKGKGLPTALPDDPFGN